jgi:hypothetical protein
VFVALPRPTAQIIINNQKVFEESFKSLQPLELVGNERKEFECVVCTSGATFFRLAALRRDRWFIEKPRVVFCCSPRVAEL